MLYTNLKHIEIAADHARIISENETVMVICGRLPLTCPSSLPSALYSLIP